MSKVSKFSDAIYDLFNDVDDDDLEAKEQLMIDLVQASLKIERKNRILDKQPLIEIGTCVEFESGIGNVTGRVVESSTRTLKIAGTPKHPRLENWVVSPRMVSVVK